MKYVSKDDKISIKKVKKVLRRLIYVSVRSHSEPVMMVLRARFQTLIQVKEMACEHFKRVRIDNGEL